MDLVTESDVPIGAGLSSSAALLCGTILAASQLAGPTLAPEEVASLAREAETEWVGVPVGIMDQLASMCSTRDHALFLDCRSLAHQQVRLDRADGDLRLALLVIDTGGADDWSKGSTPGGERHAKRWRLFSASPHCGM
jgi:galactokinase